MAFNPTSEQRDAVNAEGSVLVSAAAGSGKTAVLVERVISLLTDKQKPVGADRLLIVTFTNAAAAEMRTRIEKRLDDECRANPDDIGLLKQRQLISSAKICTIDSFCIDLVRENFETAGVSPDFKISEGGSLRPVDELVLNGLLDEYYQQGDPVFFELMDIIGAEYDDGNFSDYVLKMYDFSRQMAFPSEWFDGLAEMYAPGSFDSRGKWYSYALEAALMTAEKMRRTNAAALDLIAGDEAAYDKYGFCFEKAADKISDIYNAALKKSWDGVFGALCGFSLPSIPRAAGTAGKAAKTARDSLLASAEYLSRIFYAGEKDVSAQLSGLYKPVRLLSELLKRLEARLFEEYLERNVFTFHNIEHLALKLLCAKTESGIIPADGADELLSRYDEVMVDEYQDTNDLQDMLFYVLSDRGRKLFAVGDIKQSIYGFRGARPVNFLNKKNAAVPFAAAGENDCKKIILGSNFRSRAEICEYINFFFTLLMTEKTGGIVYNEEERLIPKAVYPQCALPPVSFDILEASGNTEEKYRAEAARIAEYIKKVMSSGKCIRKDETALREARYSDFTVLLRNPKNKAPIIAEELRKNGIPVNYSAEGYAETNEISVFLSLLKVIDNPDSDIELLTVLMSPVFGFTAEETAEFRAAKKHGSLYSALVSAAQNGDRHCEETLKALEKYRLLAVTLTLPRLVMRLLESTDFLNTVSASEDGARRRGNLLLLAGYAEQYAADNRGGIGAFVKHILKQSENGIKSASAVSGTDTVRIMSIHASKGLQFPVCIIAGTASAFNDGESKNSALYSEDYGIGFKYFDEQKGTRLSTVGREVILDSVRRRTCEEELRLLYVAMTRAEDILYFTAAVNKAEAALKDCELGLLLAEGSPENMFDDMKSYAKWLFTASLLHPDGTALLSGLYAGAPRETASSIKISVISSEENADNPEAKPFGLYLPDEAAALKIRENISYKYPYAELLEIEAKSSVSDLANKAESDKYAFSSRPAFMSDGGITAAERGTAAHKIIQFIDFDKVGRLDEEIERLYEWQYITEREAMSVNREKLNAFFRSGIFSRIRSSPLVKREMRFLTELPVCKINPALKGRFDDESVIVQGAVDLCFEEDGEIVLLDFKTDRTDSPAQLAAAYGEQLAIYAAACEKIFEKRVKQKIIYSFSLSCEIEL